MISRVYSILGMYDSTLYHAKRSLDIFKKNDIGDFDIAFTYEAMARNYKIKEDEKGKEKYLELAKRVGMEIKDEEDRNYFFSELSTITD